MYNRAHHTSVGGGPTLQHPKPVAPIYPLPSSPPPPEGGPSGPTSSSSYGSPSPPYAAGSANDYQRFASPPAQVQTLHGGGPSSSGAQQQDYYGGGGVMNNGGPSHMGSKGTPDVYVPRGSTSQHVPPHQHHQQQQYGGGGGGQGWGGSFAPGMGAAFGVNDATAAMGMQFGTSAYRAGTDYVQSNISRYVPVGHLKHSFNVSNSYVLLKLRTVLFPWRHRPWSRLVKRSEVSGQSEGYRPPREDLNSPDSYIPVMALTTYILLSGVVAGSKGRFDPELLSLSASKALGIIFLEFCCIKLGCYLLNISGEGAVVDLLAYSGYKFVGIVISLLTSLLGMRTSLNWAVFVYVFCANAFFLLRSLRYVILPDAASGYNASAQVATVSQSQKARRIQFLFAIAMSQLASMWVLSRV